MSLGCWRDVRWQASSYRADYLIKYPSGDNIMKKSLIWITAGIATVGFAVPAFAARGDSPEHIAPAPVTVATATPTMATSNTVNSTVATVSSTDDNIAHDATDDNGIDNATSNSVDDNGVDDATTNSVEDISGPCDEAEHATDPTCTGIASTSTDDTAAHDANDDNSAHSGGNDGSGQHGGNESDG
jgi:hypothetical protein